MSWVLSVFGANSTFKSQAIFLFVSMILIEVLRSVLLNIFYKEKRVQSKSCIVDMKYKVQLADNGDYIVEGLRVSDIDTLTTKTKESLSLPTRLTRYYYNGRKTPFLRKEPLLLEGKIPEKEEQKFKALLRSYFKHKKYDLESSLLACRASEVGCDIAI